MRTIAAITPFDIAAARIEIERRNALRVENHLPRLSISKELRRLHDAHIEREFEAFLDSHRALYQRILHRVIHRRARAYGNPNWRPHSFRGMELENGIREMFWQRFIRHTPTST